VGEMGETDVVGVEATEFKLKWGGEREMSCCRPAGLSTTCNSPFP
jgi:hypothetical protein